MEYTEEEKKAIERCNELKKDCHKEWIGISNQVAIDIVLNLLGRYYVYAHNYRDLLKKALDDVRKESKKNADGMKEVKPIKGFEEENIEVSKFGEWVGKNYIDYKFEYENLQRMLSDSIPKEAIREKIKELIGKLDKPNEDRWEKDDEIYYSKIKCQIKILKELLGE